MFKSVFASSAMLVFCCSGCGLEGPVVQVLTHPVTLATATVGAAAIGTAAAVDAAQTQSEEARQQTELVRRGEEIRMMTSSDRAVFDKLEGQWTFVDPSDGVGKGYQFGFNGELLQFDANSRKVTGQGSYVIDEGRVIIRWSSGGTEVATCDDISDVGLTYDIISHTDKRQVGLSMKFMR